MKRIILKAGEENRIMRGHPWVYDNEVDRTLDGAGLPAELEPGETADVESSRKRYLGRAFVNPRSKIIARIYSPSKEGVDKGFFKRRFREALARRTCRDLSRDSARLVFAEADFLPGLIVDCFTGWPLEDAGSRISQRPLTFDAARSALGPPASWLSVQFLTFGMDLRRDEILSALDEVLGAAPRYAAGTFPGLPVGIVEKSAARVRKLEGLPLREGLVRGSFPAGGVLIFENGLPFAVHPEEGQKTGHFLDQRENRLAVAEYAGTAVAGDNAARPSGEYRILDVCAYTGGFGIHAAQAVLNRRAGVRVTAVDVSASALEALKENAALNGVADRIAAVEGDCFDFLRASERAGERYDLIILDPPAFAKTRPIQDQAIRGYKEINLRALKLLSPGGILATCSCSQAMDEGRFKRMVVEAAADVERRLVQLDFRFQAKDHPILLGYDESFYLKCGIYRVL
ncbi:MAG: class I SAM-dependent rRNA methyltransferase [Treponema sp.]|nr:class I SAM-dependent rRNA methyltransferase [Treponema sp.]